MERNIIEIMNKHIYTKIKDFREKYYISPKFIKIPLWVFKELQEVKSIIIVHKTERTNLTYLGLIVCETVTINTIEEIEVF